MQGSVIDIYYFSGTGNTKLIVAECAKLCPINNIEMQQYPLKYDRYVSCMRCVAFCPYNAILRKSKIVQDPNHF